MLTETVAQYSAADFGAEVRAGLTQGGQKWDPLESTCRHASLSIL